MDKKATVVENLIYDITQLQEALGVSRNLAYRLVKKRGFPSVKINCHYYFPIDKIKNGLMKIQEEV